MSGQSNGMIAALVMVLAVVVGAAMGCTGFADEVRADRQQQADEEGQEAALQLYDTMVEVFREDTEGIDRESRNTLMVISDYERLAEDRRRRFVGRVIPAGGGIGVNITAEYQTDEASAGDEPDWEDEPREQVRAEAQPDELAMARRIERMYHGRR